jgi:hypothetical protein
MMHVNLAVACVALWTTPISASSSLLPLTGELYRSTMSKKEASNDTILNEQNRLF